MSKTLPDALPVRPVLSSDDKLPMLKADVRKADVDDQWRRAVGQAIDRVRNDAQLSLKEFADALDRDERQVARWIDGSHHAQIAAVFAVARFRSGLVLALAALTDDIEIFTELRIPKHAGRR